MHLATDLSDFGRLPRNCQVCGTWDLIACDVKEKHNPEISQGGEKKEKAASGGTLDFFGMFSKLASTTPPYNKSQLATIRTD